MSVYGFAEIKCTKNDLAKPEMLADLLAVSTLAEITLWPSHFSWSNTLTLLKQDLLLIIDNNSILAINFQLGFLQL